MTYPNERSAAFEAALPASRRALLRRFFDARPSRAKPLWARFYEWISTAPPSEIESYVEEQERESRTRKAIAAQERRKERAERALYAGAVEVKTDRRERARQKLSGKNVWLYHGTSSALLPKIEREGLCPSPPRKAYHGTTPGYVYLTVEPGTWSSRGASAMFYARQAAGVFGGEPVILRVRVAWDALERDDDDADLATGHDQYRYAACIHPEDIVVVTGSGRGMSSGTKEILLRREVRSNALIPPHDIGFGGAPYVTELSIAYRRGDAVRPVVVVARRDRKFVGLVGSHRIAAMQRAFKGVVVPERYLLVLPLAALEAVLSQRPRSLAMFRRYMESQYDSVPESDYNDILRAAASLSSKVADALSDQYV